MMDVITCCRSCGSEELTTLLELGEVPLANALLEEGESGDDEPRFPLTLVYCASCSLVQIRETVDPSVLFSSYNYASSFSETMLAHAAAAVEAHVARCGLGPDSFVVEVASNDGYLLKNFVAKNIPVLGIDPAENIAERAEAAGVPTLCDFFGVEVAERVASKRGRADLMLANNVIAHVADLNGVAEGFARLLAPTGTAVLEFPYLGDMIDEVEFDTIYHEHLCYYSLHAIAELFRRHGLSVVDVERLSIHGGSLRLFLQPSEGAAAPSDAVVALRREEEERGMTSVEFYLDFAARVRSLCDDLVAELRRRKEAGQSLAAYGASAKGSTLMNTCGLGSDLLDFVVDRSTVKQGKRTPGNHLPILAPEVLLERRPDAVLLLTWNFADEIVAQQAAYLDGGGEFLVPVPELRTVRRGETS